MLCINLPISSNCYSLSVFSYFCISITSYICSIYYIEDFKSYLSSWDFICSENYLSTLKLLYYFLLSNSSNPLSPPLDSNFIYFFYQRPKARERQVRWFWRIVWVIVWMFMKFLARWVTLCSFWAHIWRLNLDMKWRYWLDWSFLKSEWSFLF